MRLRIVPGSLRHTSMKNSHTYTYSPFYSSDKPFPDEYRVSKKGGLTEIAVSLLLIKETFQTFE